MNSPWWAHMHVNPVRMAMLLAAAAPLAACSGISVKPNPTPPNYIADKGHQYGSLSNSTMGCWAACSANRKPKEENGGGAALGVNAYLWRGALDTLSFMPLASADPFGGVIITDWYTPPSSPDERFKATAYILGRRAAQRRRPDQHLPPGDAGRPLGGCAGQQADRRRYREQGAGARPPVARAVPGKPVGAPGPSGWFGFVGRRNSVQRPAGQDPPPVGCVMLNVPEAPWPTVKTRRHSMQTGAFRVTESWVARLPAPSWPAKVGHSRRVMRNAITDPSGRRQLYREPGVVGCLRHDTGMDGRPFAGHDEVGDASRPGYPASRSVSSLSWCRSSNWMRTVPPAPRSITTSTL